MQQQERHPEGHRVGDAAELKIFTISEGPPQQSQIKEKEGKEGTRAVRGLLKAIEAKGELPACQSESR